MCLVCRCIGAGKVGSKARYTLSQQIAASGKYLCLELALSKGSPFSADLNQQQLSVSLVYYSGWCKGVFGEDKLLHSDLLAARALAVCHGRR